MSRSNNQAVCKKRPSSSTSSIVYPIRNLSHLYCSPITYACALGTLPLRTHQATNEHLPTQQSHAPSDQSHSRSKPCISCAYKIGNFDIALDAEFTKRVPNVRPECCPRAKLDTMCIKSDEKTSREYAEAETGMGYQRGMSVLTVGDGDFTFSLAVARLVRSTYTKSPGGRVANVVATSFEEESTLQKVYPDYISTLNELKQYNVQVCYKVDATSLNETLPTSLALPNGNERYHRIVWNFPCTAISMGQDGQNSAMEENKELVRKFVSNALPYLSRDGEILIAHKTKPPFCQWGMEKVALEGVDQSKLGYKGRVVFDKCLLKPYTPRKALDRKSFPCHDACIYVFGRKKNCRSDFEHTLPKNDEFGSRYVMEVTNKMIDKIRSLHLRLAETKRDGQTSRKKGNKRRKRI